PGHFTMSHSGDVVIFAASRTRAVGVDIERIRPMDEASTLTETFFTYQEREAIRRVASDLQMEAFYKCWTRRDALFKATRVPWSSSLDREQALPILDERPRSVLLSGQNGLSTWTVLTIT